MIFENSSVSFHLLDVLALDQESIHTYNTGRNFAALSFRISADAVLQTAGEVHHLTDNCVSFVPARLDYSRIAKRDKMIVVHFDVINYRTDRIEWFLPKEPEKIKALFDRILDIWNKKETGYQYQCAAVLYEILGECYRQTEKTELKNTKIQKSVDYISKHYTEPELTIETVAAQSYMSQVYFRKLFKAEYRIPPQKYIIQLRMQYAIGLIATGYYPLKEIAALAGYTDYKYFSVEFKKHMGVSPSEYVYNHRS